MVSIAFREIRIAAVGELLARDRIADIRQRWAVQENVARISSRKRCGERGRGRRSGGQGEGEQRVSDLHHPSINALVPPHFAREALVNFFHTDLSVQTLAQVLQP